MVIRYIIDFSLKNGLGKPSISLYLKGCDKKVKCPDCHNYEMQEESKDDYDINNIITELDKYILNFQFFNNELYVCILGGEPLTEYNKEITYTISKHVKEKYKYANVVLYSWKTLEIIEKQNLNDYLKYIDYGVLGSYDKDLYVKDMLPSSTNQYIYDFKNNKTIKPIQLRRG